MSLGEMKNSDTFADKEHLKSIYQGTYVQKLQTQSPYRIMRLVPYFDLETEDVVADFGCGTGLLVDFIGDRIQAYAGVDWSAQSIEVARERVSQESKQKVSFECADIVEFCGRHPATFHKAFTLDFSEHIYDSEFLAIYSAIYDALKPGATLYLHTPNRDYLFEFLKQVGLLKQTPGHVAVRTANEYQELLTGIGFSEFQVRFLQHYVTPLKQLHLLSRVPFFGRFFKARMLVTARKRG
jgi:2-polyprenyl-6-hydroxyphenyl methylase / 3-demethylubiquinone-9 3-methyltransferase